jgi:Dolichyl-phosphate-mannose-protein mannosyltransferase
VSVLDRSRARAEPTGLSAFAGKGVLIVLAAIVAAAFAVRLDFLSVPVRPDEAVTFMSYATHPLSDGLGNYSLPNNHLLNTLAVHVSWRLFGQDEWTLRLPALIAGLCTIPAAFLLGRELYGRYAALWGAGLVAGSSALIQYSTNGRGYMPGTLFVVVALLCASWAARTHRRLAWAGFAISSVLAIYSVPSMAFGILVAGVWVAWNALAAAPRGMCWASSRRTLQELGATLLVVAAASAALYAPTFGDGGWTPASDVVPRAADSGEKSQLVRDIWGFYHEGLPFPVKLLILGAAMLAVVQHRRIGRHTVPLAPVAVILALPVIALWDPPVFARNWIELLPLYLVTAGAGFALVTRELAARIGRGWTELQLTRVGLALVLAAAIAPMVSLAIRGEDALVLDSPRGDPEVADFKSRELADEPLAAGTTGVLAAAYYFRRDGAEGLVSGKGIPDYAGALNGSSPAGHLAVLAVNGEEDPTRVAASAGVTPRPGASPRLIRRYRYTSIYEVPTSR